ncbi:hypothetical protein DPMN_075308 [Dreissena polymorpha]|uniref:Uncharacterized protein n=1 Tax=Dreissena polymorpha TaxID=45954 RepID=A0A9D3YGX7_DREPO|nr:hypothetical protein DPMN_075308 [Dreissena polymorpha]
MRKEARDGHLKASGSAVMMTMGMTRSGSASCSLVACPTQPPMNLLKSTLSSGGRWSTASL